MHALHSSQFGNDLSTGVELELDRGAPPRLACLRRMELLVVAQPAARPPAIQRLALAQESHPAKAMAQVVAGRRKRRPAELASLMQSDLLAPATQHDRALTRHVPPSQLGTSVTFVRRPSGRLSRLVVH